MRPKIKTLDEMLDTEYPFPDNHPYPDPSTKEKYYDVGGIEVIDYIKAKLTEDQFRGYLLGNIFKYSGRMQYKGDYNKDLYKLNHYTSWLKDLDYKEVEL
jgi:hypothetical protein